MGENPTYGDLPSYPTPYGTSATTVLTTGYSPDEFEATLRTRYCEFAWSKYFQEGWALYKHNWVYLLLAALMWFVILVAIQGSIGVVLGIARAILLHDQTRTEVLYDSKGAVIGTETRMTPLGYMIEFIFFVINMIISFCIFVFLHYPVIGSWWLAIFNAMRRDTQQIRFKDFFSGFATLYYPRVASLAIPIFVLTTLLSFLLWIPGIYFSLTMLFALPLIMEHPSMGVTQVMGHSFAIFHRYFCAMLGFVIISILVYILGFLCLIVGVFFAAPIISCWYAIVYHHLIGVNGVIPWPTVIPKA